MKPHTEEHRKKISEAHKGKPSGMLGHKHSEESKAKMAKSHTGLKISDETKAKMAAKRTAYWANIKAQNN